MKFSINISLLYLVNCNVSRLGKLENSAHDVLDMWFGNTNIHVNSYKNRYTNAVKRLERAFKR